MTAILKETALQVQLINNLGRLMSPMVMHLVTSLKILVLNFTLNFNLCFKKAIKFTFLTVF